MDEIRDALNGLTWDVARFLISLGIGVGTMAAAVQGLKGQTATATGDSRGLSSSAQGILIAVIGVAMTAISYLAVGWVVTALQGTVDLNATLPAW